MAWALLLGYPLVTLFELLSPAWVFSPRFRWAWIAVMVPFHIGTGLLMGIWFNYNLALIPLLVAGFVPRWISHVGSDTRDPIRRDRNGGLGKPLILGPFRCRGAG